MDHFISASAQNTSKPQISKLAGPKRILACSSLAVIAVAAYVFFHGRQVSQNADAKPVDFMNWGPKYALGSALYGNIAQELDSGTNTPAEALARAIAERPELTAALQSSGMEIWLPSSRNDWITADSQSGAVILFNPANTGRINWSAPDQTIAYANMNFKQGVFSKITLDSVRWTKFDLPPSRTR